MNKILCLGVSKQFTNNIYEQVELIRNAGFDATFVEWSYDLRLDCFVEAVKKAGIYVQSVHAPFYHMAEIWGEDEIAASAAVKELCDCLTDCANNLIPIVVLHAFIGFWQHSPNQVGLDRMEKVVNTVKNTHTKIAFENTEGIEYLDAIMDRFSGNENVGFCWDTGHEMCYNHSVNLLSKYGSRLICTHLNDNLGIKSKTGETTFLDDLHLLPFDGIADWDELTNRLHKVAYNKELTFELNTVSKPNRHENDKYSAVPIETYFAEAFSRACRVAALLSRKEQNENGI